ncbi:FTR1 family protein [Nitrosopumilus sp. Nsub]|uniref:FTR1 family iron permease n=1 Tax=Nitrosopumilus sp. Nsub TaxID=1776294 RepID=UPI0009E9D46C|nr:FTR1 family protein [Nitrosopumilus sp. Nsub]
MSKKNNLIRIFFAILMFASIAPNIEVLAETTNMDTVVLSTTEILAVSLDVVDDNVQNGNFEQAKQLTKENSEFFSLQVLTLRESNSEITDEIHILLLDMHNEIKSGNENLISNNVATIKNLLKQYEINSPDYGMANAMILTTVDEQYQIANKEGDEYRYEVSEKLLERVIVLFEKTDFDERLTLEISDFLVDLKNHIQNREKFTSVGMLITAINRDFTGIEAVPYEKEKLYENIRALYKELLVAIDNGDYAQAEELGIEAYLENFEYLEPDIEKVDAEHLYKLEIDMREELRKMIKFKESPAAIRAFLEESILPDLAYAQDLVTKADKSILQSKMDRELKEMGDATDTQKSGVRGEIDFIRDTLQLVLVQYQDGQYPEAYNSARTAYLDSYEFVEIPLRAIDPDFTLEVEFQFAELRSLIKQQADFEEIKDVTIKIKRNLDESERLVSGTGTLAPAIAFTSSFAIIFREGLESVLILGAIITYLEASRNTKYKKYLYYGVVAAIGATGITWVIASYIIEISGANRELIEAIAALSATAILFYVSFWVLNKIEHKKWMEFVKAKVWQATTTGSVMVFVGLAFFTVYREGFETVLFYQAMSSFAKYMEVYVILGFIVGMGSLLLLFYIMRKLGKRLPLRALFGLTMGVGAYLSIAFLGNAIRELQVIEIMPYTGMIGIIPRLDINLAAMTGIYPTLETVVGQIILLGIYLAAASYVLVLRPKRENKIAEMRKSRKVNE